MTNETNADPLARRDDNPVADTGTFLLGGDLPVRRLGFGAMRLPGPGVWGEPTDPDAARAVLRRAIDLGMNLIDTADFYGPEVANRLIAETLHPYPDDLVIATKVGFVRGADRSWQAAARPERLRAAVEDNLRHLRLDHLELVYLRLGGEGYPSVAEVPLAESLGALADLRAAGTIRHIGISNVTTAQLAAARELVPIAAVTNRYNLADRAGEAVLAAAVAAGIAFVPYNPLAIGALAREGGPLAEIARRHAVAPAQIALAWLLARSPAMLLIPGTTSVAHLEENARAATLHLTAAEIAALAG